jgi:type II restriction/modification system DNA methylase subunit YeeA
MNTNKIKSYAPKARRDFIAAVTRRAGAFGLSAKGTAPVREEGQLVFIEGQPYPQSVGAQRQKLAARVEQHGFDQTMEAAAYTWFNRLIAIRFMELHGYLDHSFRVLSHPAGQALPEVLGHAEHLDLPGLDREWVITLKMDGTRDEELYRELLLAQCRALHQAMPFLFESVDDETELLLPENLLQTDSLIRELVTAIPEDDWQEIEIIGWLYQFYISEKKDQVIGKVVKSEDIPAATQLFTPNWIVKYMVQNSLGAQWLATYPDSPLKGQMAYYIEPAEQTEEVGAALAALTPSTLNPEELTLIDPACGSGHILVEAYDLFKAIYLERGYRQRDVARLILEKNLYGLDIDGRAAQLTGFALTMKARADDRRLFERDVTVNVLALRESKGLEANELARILGSVGGLGETEALRSALALLIETFAEAKTFGSLIQVPEALAAKLPELRRWCELESQDLFVVEALRRLRPLVRQAELLARRYDAVVANPPYMGSKGMNPLVKKFAGDNFPDAKSDLFACFIERGYTLAKTSGYNAMVTMQSWMFLSSFEKVRARMLREKTIYTMAHLGARAFGSISGEVVQTTACVLQNRSLQGYKPVFFRLIDGGEDEKKTALAKGKQRFDATAQDEFKKIPGSAVAYWVSAAEAQVFSHQKIGDLAETRLGMATASNDLFLRFWQEVRYQPEALKLSSREDAKKSGGRWFPYQKGGYYRKWYGNLEYLVDWQDDGWRIQNFKDDKTGKVRSHNYNLDFIFRNGITWNALSSSLTSARFSENSLFDNAGSSAFSSDQSLHPIIVAFLNSSVVIRLIKVISPTLNYQPGDIAKLPAYFDFDGAYHISENAIALAEMSRFGWDAYERSWDFQSLPILTASTDPTPTLESSYTAWIKKNRQTIAEMKRLEEENNRLFIDAYGLQDELTPEVPIEQITLTVNPAYRYGKKLADDEWSVEHGFGEELETRFREDTMQELVSYAIGCMMGRYSLDAPGLIYAHSGNQGFDPSRYARFPADADGILPITDTDWFDDDAAHRLVEFIAVAWDKAHLEQNLSFLADNLSPKKDESSRETIRRYLSDRFFKDHLQTYKNRPIYWCFTSGKQKAFQCLVYLHRYHEGTLARMRMEYVVPLQGKMAARIDRLVDDIASASTTAQAKRLQKERDKLTRQLDELRRYDEQLRHYADQRIALDLDDGVKVNFSKFGDLLAEVKAVTGTSAE